MKPTIEALAAAQNKLAEAREYLSLAHSLYASGLAELLTIDLLGQARELETKLARAIDAFRNS